MNDLQQCLARVFSFERKLIRQQLVQHDAGRKNICSRIHRGILNLFRGHVLYAPQQLTGAGDMFSTNPSDSEVNQFHRAIFQ